MRKVICSYPRTRTRTYSRRSTAGRIELELVPQGTLSERIRAGGAGIGGFYRRDSAGTKIADGKENARCDGELHVLERPIRADVALIRAERGDRWGISSIASRRGTSIR